MSTTRTSRVVPVPHSLPCDLRSLQRISMACLFLFGLGTFYLNNAHSQVIQTPASEEQRRRAQVEEQERQRLLQEPRVELPTEAQPEALETFTLPTEAPCFPLDQITLEVSSQLSDRAKFLGASKLQLDPFFFAQQYLQHYVGQCVGKEGLNLIIQRLTNLILQKGYSTTRVGLAEQDLSSGKLIVTIVPGIIHAIRFSDPSLYGTWRNAFPTSEGQLLNLRDLEQGLEQMKRVPSQEVDMQIVPSEIPGESDIVLTVKRSKNWKVTASLDNSGAKGTGPLQGGINLAIDNPLGLSDLLNIGFNSDANRDGIQRGTTGRNLYYALPFGNAYASLSASDYNYHQQIAGNDATLVSSGKSQNLDLKLNYVVQRDQTQKNSMQFNIGKRWSRAFIDSAALDTNDRDATFVELGWLHKHYFGNAQLDVTLLNRWGATWFGAQQNAPNQPPDEPTRTYALQTVDATLSLPFRVGSQPFTYLATLRGQTTLSPLFVADQFSIGGRYTVRGFDGELTLTAERGFYLRNELDIPIAGSTHSAYVGIDAGKVYGPTAPFLVGDKLVGAAIGVRGSYKNLSYDLFSGWPLYRPKEFQTAIPSLGFSLTFQY